MSERNGPDIAAVYQLLREMAQKLDGLDARFEAMREKVIFYHSAVLGHSIAIGDLVERVKRLEKVIDEISAAATRLPSELTSAIVSYRSKAERE